MASIPVPVTLYELRLINPDTSEIMALWSFGEDKTRRDAMRDTYVNSGYAVYTVDVAAYKLLGVGPVIPIGIDANVSVK